MKNLNLEIIQEVDKQNMYQLLKDYWLHIEKAINNAKRSTAIFSVEQIKSIIILGIGGSAISGEILRNYLYRFSSTANINVKIIRGNDIPDIVDSNTCVFVSSYSGNTDETLTALDIVKNKTKNLIAITSGGKLEELFNKENLPVLKLPEGMMPRCSLMYSFFHLLYVLLRHNILNYKDDIEPAINSLINRKNDSIFDYSKLTEDNIAINIAKKFFNNIPVIYSSDRFEAVNLRWRAQIQENANSMAFGNILPEANHNEINGWSMPSDILKRFIVLFLKDYKDVEILKNAMKLSNTILENNKIASIELYCKGNEILTKIFDFICIGDWVSFYLAILNNVDPTPIPNIMNLKAMMKK